MRRVYTAKSLRIKKRDERECAERMPRVVFLVLFQAGLFIRNNKPTFAHTLINSTPPLFARILVSALIILAFCRQRARLLSMFETLKTDTLSLTDCCVPTHGILCRACVYMRVINSAMSAHPSAHCEERISRFVSSEWRRASARRLLSLYEYTHLVERQNERCGEMRRFSYACCSPNRSS